MRKRKPTSDRYELKVGGEANLSEGGRLSGAGPLKRCRLARQVRIRTIPAPIHNHDLWTIRGLHGYKSFVPAFRRRLGSRRQGRRPGRTRNRHRGREARRRRLGAGQVGPID